MATPAQASRCSEPRPHLLPAVAISTHLTPDPRQEILRGWADKVVAGTGALGFGLGILVLIGWHAGYVLPLSGWWRESLPVRYNAGLCLMLFGLALLLLGQSRFTLAHLAAATVSLIGLLTTCEYAFVFDFGIDRLIFDSTRVAPSIPARMAPNAAVCFLILGGSVLLATQKPGRARNALQAFAAALAASVSLAGLIGYVVDVPTAYSWGNLTPIAAPTAVGMLALGAGVVAFAWGQSTSQLDVTPPWAAVLAAMAVTTVAVALWQALNALHTEPAITWLTLAAGLLQAALLYLALHLLRTTRERARQLRQLNATLQTELAERERVERSLRHSEERYRALLVAIAQVVWTTPPDGLVEDMPMWREYTGQSLEEVRGWGWLNAIHPEDRERTGAIWSKAVKTHGLYETEYRIRRADGQYRHFAIRGVPVLEEGGSIREWVGTCTDIHERKQTAEGLCLSEQRYRALVLASAQVVWTTDSQGLVVSDMPLWRDFTGQTQEQIQGWGWITCLHPDDREHTTRVWSEALASKSLYEVEYRMRRRDGEYRHMAVRGAPILEEDGSIREWVGTCTDIHERKRAEEELRLNRERLLLAQKVGRSGTFDWDIRNNINTWSPEIEELYGLPAGGFTGTFEAWEKLVFPADLEKARAAITESLKTGEFQGEWRIIRPRDGQTRWLAARAKVLFDETGQPSHMIGINIDITERKQLEESLRQRTLELENSVAELEAFSYSVSHDLRAPLRSIDGFSQILLEDYRDKVDQEGQDSLRRIRNASQNMAQLIDALLQLSRVMRSELRREPVDLSVLALSTAAMIQKADPARRVRFQVVNGLQANGDRRLLGVALQNLLQNAWKFSARNPEPSVEFGSTQKDGKTAYYVRDNGIGFDMTYVNKLFTPFQRLHAKEQFEGTGIGLATVQRVIKRHGGKVWAEGAVDKGATFYFSLD